MSFWTLYLLSRLDGLKSLFCISSISLFVFIGIVAIMCFVVTMSDESTKAVSKWFSFYKSILFKFILIPLFLSIILNIILPSFKQALMFMGIDYVTHNERVLENTDKALNVFESYIDSKLNQLKGGKDEVEEETANQ